MNKSENLKMVRELKERLYKLLYADDPYNRSEIVRYNDKINDALIWLDRYAATFNSTDDIKSEEVEKIEDLMKVVEYLYEAVGYLEKMR
jgi:hypothetical protein